MNKKELIFCFVVFLVVLFSIGFVLGEVRINEVMTHTNNNYGKEWVELHNEGNENLTLTLWKISDGVGNNKKNFSLNISAGGFALIVDYNSSNNCSFFNLSSVNCFELNTLSLNDDGDNLSLYNSSSVLISNFTWNKDIRSSGKSFSYNGTSWLNCTPTPGTENNCTIPVQNSTCNYGVPTCSTSWSTCVNSIQNKTCVNSTTTPNCSNLTYYITQSCTMPSAPGDIYIELDWDEEYIINRDEFDITVKAYNLEDNNYDVLVEIQNEDGKTISERYGKYGTNNSNVWKSSTFYALEFVSGSGDDSADMKLKIDSDYSYFLGDATIIAKIRENGKTSVIDEFEEDIKVLGAEEDNTNNTNTSTTLTSNVIKSANESGIIKLGSKNLKETDETEGIKTEKSTIYKSKNEYIKEYAIYGFAVLCVFLIALLLIDKK